MRDYTLKDVKIMLKFVLWGMTLRFYGRFMRYIVMPFMPEAMWVKTANRLRGMYEDYLSKLSEIKKEID